MSSQLNNIDIVYKILSNLSVLYLSKNNISIFCSLKLFSEGLMFTKLPIK